MNDSENIKKDLKQVKFLLKDIWINIVGIFKDKLNEKLEKNPIKILIVSNVIIFSVTALFSVYWYLKYKVIQRNQDRTSYIISQQVDSQKDSIEMETRVLYEKIYKDKIDSLTNEINASKAPKKPYKKRYWQKTNSYPQTEKTDATSQTNVSNTNQNEMLP